jgi:hypothetical protein
VAELGRIDKTIHALTYIDDEVKRRRILNQLNKDEDRFLCSERVRAGSSPAIGTINNEKKASGLIQKPFSLANRMRQANDCALGFGGVSQMMRSLARRRLI